MVKSGGGYAQYRSTIETTTGAKTSSAPCEAGLFQAFPVCRGYCSSNRRLALDSATRGCVPRVWSDFLIRAHPILRIECIVAGTPDVGPWRGPGCRRTAHDIRPLSRSMPSNDAQRYHDAGLLFMQLFTMASLWLRFESFHVSDEHERWLLAPGIPSPCSPGQMWCGRPAEPTSSVHIRYNCEPSTLFSQPSSEGPW
jgi:hypothetical protein